jgi:hypothetical protein
MTRLSILPVMGPLPPVMAGGEPTIYATTVEARVARAHPALTVEVRPTEHISLRPHAILMGVGSRSIRAFVNPTARIPPGGFRQ